MKEKAELICELLIVGLFSGITIGYNCGTNVGFFFAIIAILTYGLGSLKTLELPLIGLLFTLFLGIYLGFLGAPIHGLSFAIIYGLSFGILLGALSVASIYVVILVNKVIFNQRTI